MLVETAKGVLHRHGTISERRFGNVVDDPARIAGREKDRCRSFYDFDAFNVISKGGLIYLEKVPSNPVECKITGGHFKPAHDILTILGGGQQIRSRSEIQRFTDRLHLAVAQECGRDNLRRLGVFQIPESEATENRRNRRLIRTGGSDNDLLQPGGVAGR
jgi:hypothetical protein